MSSTITEKQTADRSASCACKAGHQAVPLRLLAGRSDMRFLSFLRTRDSNAEEGGHSLKAVGSLVCGSMLATVRIRLHTAVLFFNVGHCKSTALNE